MCGPESLMVVSTFKSADGTFYYEPPNEHTHYAHVYGLKTTLGHTKSREGVGQNSHLAKF